MATTDKTPDAIDEIAIRGALSKILTSETFVRSPKVSRLLSYLVERRLADDDDAMKELPIARDVFGQPNDFNPRSNPIVRVNASRLRNLLRLYYAGAGSTDTVRIALPDVGYRPEFTGAERSAEMSGASPAGHPVVTATGSDHSEARPPSNSSHNHLFGALGAHSTVGFVLINFLAACLFAILFHYLTVSRAGRLYRLTSDGLDNQSIVLVCERPLDSADPTSGSVGVDVNGTRLQCWPMQPPRTVARDPA